MNITIEYISSVDPETLRICISFSMAFEWSQKVLREHSMKCNYSQKQTGWCRKTCGDHPHQHLDGLHIK